ncbi:phosphoribosylaminoimidazolesuccinocarboxamide synthase [Candidatus Poribacteria bacterium]|nr:phosphoribosylaminoimidazolesuccinocarboxamide synthase [Candidatus Poribacteria bacterium]
MTQNTITETSLTNLDPTHQGKVRDLYEIEDKLLIVSTDRISAYDFVLPNGIPYKGQVLTGISEFWFDYTEPIVKNHMITTNPAEYPGIQQSDIPMLNGRSMLGKKANRIDIECVVRGYIAGSAWKEYQADGTVCGETLPAGLIESEKLPELIFTPATKAEQGDHDENISIQRMKDEIGVQLAEQLIETSFKLFQSASAHADSVGLILCDTKFEFGLVDGELILIDEIFTPDSSRFWPKDLYNPGGPQQSFDKQFVRDYLMEIGWNKQPPVPQLSDEVVHKTSEKYLEAYRLIIGSELS